MTVYSLSSIQRAKTVSVSLACHLQHPTTLAPTNLTKSNFRIEHAKDKSKGQQVSCP